MILTDTESAVDVWLVGFLLTFGGLVAIYIARLLEGFVVWLFDKRFKY